MTGRITVFGGTEFIGRHLVSLLLQSGATVRVAVRHSGCVKMAAEPTNSPEIVVQLVSRAWNSLAGFQMGRNRL